MSQSRKRLFIENFIAYGAINALDKIVPLVMLPIVTRLISDTGDYGRFAMFNTIAGFGSSFAVLGIYDAMFREYFEKDSLEYKSLVTSTSAKIVFFSSLVITLLLIVFSKSTSQLFLNTSDSWHISIWAALGTFISANKAIISAPTRMKNQRNIYVFSGISSSLIYYATAIVFIKLGFNYHGLIYGSTISSLYLLLFFYILNRKDFNFKIFNTEVAKELLKIGVPLVPCFVIYWAFNSMDKIMISHMLNLQEVGVYSIGAKVASVSTFIYAAFAGGWQYFAFSTMKDKDQVELTSKIFEYLGVLSFLAFMAATLFNDMIFNLFFTGDYVRGSEVFPYLFLSPLILMLFQTAGNQLLVIKKSYLSAICLSIGLLVNLGLNYKLLPLFGIAGAALATLMGYLFSTLFMLYIVKQYKLIKINSRFFIAFLGVTIYVFIIFSYNINLYLNYLYITLFIVLFIILYYSDIVKYLEVNK